jgi:phosphosulfolactate phosphohydrolase-like enzyme
VHDFLRGTRGGQNLLALGYDSDIRLCSQISTADVVPEYDLQSGELQHTGRAI